MTFTPLPEQETVPDSEPSDKALWIKGKRGKNQTKDKGKARPGWESNWTREQTWPPTPKGKGRGTGHSGKGQSSWDRPPLWCDIHQCYGHSTDWCYQNPHRTGGKPHSNDALWCDTCHRSGHSAATCFATTIQAPQGKGTPPSKGGKNKSQMGDRNWKSQNFPAGYQSEQATPALHDNTPSTASQEWWEPHELGSVALERIPPTFFLDDADDDEVAAYIDLIILAIINNMERLKQYTQTPSHQLRHEIIDHDTNIATAQLCTNIHIQRIITNFKSTINYNDNSLIVETRLQTALITEMTPLNNQMQHETSHESRLQAALLTEITPLECQLQHETSHETKLQTALITEMTPLENQMQHETSHVKE